MLETTYLSVLKSEEAMSKIAGEIKAEMSAPYSRRPNERPRASATEWEEASANSRPRGLAYALWLQLWHWDAETVWGDLLKETRNCGYDGEIE